MGGLLIGPPFACASAFISSSGPASAEDHCGGLQPVRKSSSTMPMDHDSYSDSYIRGILNTVKTIAMVGVSANTRRPSYFALKYLLERRYQLIPVNPGL